MVTTKQASVQQEAPAPQPTDTERVDEESPADAQSQQMDISKDELFHVLQNERRRRVLTYLLHREGPYEMRSIAEQVAAWEHDTTVRQLMSDERQRVYIALYQSHLPKLDEVGLIDYEQKRGVVEPTPLLDTVSQYVDPPEDDTDEGSDDDTATDGDADTDTTPNFDERHAYMGATAVSLFLTGGVWLRSIPAALLSGVQLAMVVTGLFALTTAAFALARADSDY